jgi:hypothetical protein
MLGSLEEDRGGGASRGDLDRCLALGADGCLLNDVALGAEAARGRACP